MREEEELAISLQSKGGREDDRNQVEILCNHIFDCQILQICLLPFPRLLPTAPPHSGCAALSPFIVLNSGYDSGMLYGCGLEKSFG